MKVMGAYTLIEDGQQVWYSMYDGRQSAPFNCKGAALAWLSLCVARGRYRS